MSEPSSVTAVGSSGLRGYDVGVGFESNTPAKSRLILSLFPGAGLLDRGFELAGFCVVRGPDTVFGQRIESFRATSGHFAGIIGGPPCQDFSRARRRPPTGHGERMLAQYARVVTEAQPEWWLMENVPGVPDVHISGYRVQRFNLITGRQQSATAACRKRLQRARDEAAASQTFIPYLISNF